MGSSSSIKTKYRKFNIISNFKRKKIQKVFKKQNIKVKFTKHQNSDNLIGDKFEIPIQSFDISVASLKDRLTELVGITSIKQKITIERVGIVKDDCSLSSYKVESGMLVHIEEQFLNF